MYKLVLAAVASLMLGGCATVTRGTSNQVQIVSEPSGADVRTSLAQSCTTPCTLNVSRKDEFSVIISKPGYREQTVEVKTQVAGSGAAGFAGNVLVGGVVGMGVDAATGAALEHAPNPVSVVLQPVGPPPRGIRTPPRRAPAAGQRRQPTAEPAPEEPEA